MKNFILFLITTLFLVSCGGKRKENHETPQKITILLDWKVGSEHAFLYAGKKLGYFKDNGIDLEIVQGNGSTYSANMVDAKSVDFALCSGETALQSKTAESPRNIQVVSVYYPNTPTVIYSLEEKGITIIEDLYGKSIGIMKGSSAYKNYNFFCQINKVDKSKIKEVATTGDIREVIDKNSTIDAMVHFGFQHPLKLRLNGYKINEIKLADYDIQIYGQSLITHSDLIEKNPALVRLFVHAVQKSYLYTIANPNEALTIFLDNNPQSDKEYAKAKLEWVNNFVLSGLNENKIIGYQTDSGWLKTYNYLKSIDTINREINIKGFYTNKFLGYEFKVQ